MLFVLKIGIGLGIEAAIKRKSLFMFVDILRT